MAETNANRKEIPGAPDAPGSPCVSGFLAIQFPNLSGNLHHKYNIERTLHCYLIMSPCVLEGGSVSKCSPNNFIGLVFIVLTRCINGCCVP